MKRFTMPTDPAWPALFAISILWLACCGALTYCCVSDLLRQCREDDRKLHAPHPATTINVYDEPADNDTDYLQMLQETVPPPQVHHIHYPIPQRVVPGYAAASMPMGSRPIRAWSDAAD